MTEERQPAQEREPADPPAPYEPPVVEDLDTSHGPVVTAALAATQVR